MLKILISDKLSPAATEIFQRHGITADVRHGLTKEQLIEIIADYDGLAVRSETKVTRDVIERATRLKVIGRAGIGVDNVDVPAATARGIVVMNTPFGNSVTTAEHAVAMMMALARRIPQASTSTHAGKWEKSKFMGVELTGKTLAVIGCGNIGSIVADRARGLRMRVLAYDPFLTRERAESLGIEKTELDDAIAQADFITLHTPLTDATRHLFDAARLARCKQGARIINCARGGLIHEPALKSAIESGHIAGAALDVFEVEPAKENILFGMEHVVLTPHLGASTNEAQENVALQIAEQMSDFLNTGAITNAVNIPSISAAEATALKPYFKLARQIGTLAGQLQQSPIQSIAFEYEGHVAALNTKPLSLLLAQGVMAVFDQNVNMVNALYIAKERGMAVSETKIESEGNYKTLIRLRIVTEKESFSCSGTLFDGDKPRIVEVNGITLEAVLSASMLFSTNDDKPGFIGNLGKILGDADINIAHFHLGRNQSKTEAMALVTVDSPVRSDVISTIKKLSSVRRVVALDFSGVV